jgi:hypothetical protein
MVWEFFNSCLEIFIFPSGFKVLGVEIMVKLELSLYNSIVKFYM